MTVSFSIRLKYSAVCSLSAFSSQYSFFISSSSQLLQTHCANPSQQFSFHCYADEAQLTRLCKSERDESYSRGICLTDRKCLRHVLNETPLLPSQGPSLQHEAVRYGDWISGVL